MKRRNIHVKGLLFLVSALVLLFVSYWFAGLDVDIVSYRIGTSTKAFGAMTGLGILLTLSAGFLLGFFFYLVELVRIRNRYRVINEIRKRRRRDR